ncbi:MAG: hypothetical protein IKN26_01010, partial [Eubacterium sp.]|nr:hypothetical protein [Eubacterium sp.]
FTAVVIILKAAPYVKDKNDNFFNKISAKNIDTIYSALIEKQTQFKLQIKLRVSSPEFRVFGSATQLYNCLSAASKPQPIRRMDFIARNFITQ